MLYTIAVVLLVLWLLGFFAFHVGSGLIHILLVVAVIMVIINLVQGRRAPLKYVKYQEFYEMTKDYSKNSNLIFYA
jgi:hypothetical protein